MDATPYTYVHLDYFATTASRFEFFLIDDSLSETVCCGNPAEPFYGFGSSADAPLVQGQWVSVFIPLSHFSNFNPGWDGTDLKQTKFTGDGTIYFDNIYFSTDNSLGFNEFTQSAFKVYPNPSGQDWVLTTNNLVVSKIEVFDILGKKVKTMNTHSQNITIGGSDLKSGMYLAKVYSEQGINTLRLVKK